VKVDFVFRQVRLALFVDGCFWHGCPLHGDLPASNRQYWQRKLTRNRKRDMQATRALEARGWRVVRLWEHSLKRPHFVERRLRNALVRI
jgi:DNA mismatch endonuclease (patch repair protein)